MKSDRGKIKLSNGLFAKIDEADYPIVSMYKWHFNRYAYTLIGGGHHWLSMHRLILNPPTGMEVDHINRDKLDNRRSNLRVCTPSQNRHNHGNYSTNKSGYNGVSFEKQTRRWYATIWHNGRNIHLGRFDSKESAAIAYNELAKNLRNEFAVLNVVNSKS